MRRTLENGESIIYYKTHIYIIVNPDTHYYTSNIVPNMNT